MKETKYEEMAFKYDYCSYSGLVFNRKTGVAIGHTDSNSGYVVIRHKKRNYPAHRLAWFIHYGALPEEIDHINHIRSDNRLANLRVATRADNCQNKSKYKSNRSSVSGVYWNKKSGKWLAQIRFNKKPYYLGLFNEISEAEKAVSDKRNELGFHKNHGK